MSAASTLCSLAHKIELWSSAVRPFKFKTAIRRSDDY